MMTLLVCSAVCFLVCYWSDSIMINCLKKYNLFFCIFHWRWLERGSPGTLTEIKWEKSMVSSVIATLFPHHNILVSSQYFWQVHANAYLLIHSSCFSCLFVCLSACLTVCLSVCPHALVSDSGIVCLSVCLSVLSMVKSFRKLTD